MRETRFYRAQLTLFEFMMVLGTCPSRNEFPSGGCPGRRWTILFWMSWIGWNRFHLP